MHTKLLLVIGVLAVTGLIGWLDYSHRPAMVVAVKPVAVQPLAPEVMVQPVDADEGYALSTLKGKVIVLNFWASWCAPCLEEFPLLIELAQRYPDRLELVMLSADRTPKEAYDMAQKISQQRGLFDEASGRLFASLPNVHIAWDEGKRIAQDQFQTVRYPETVVITPDFRLHDKVVGVLSEADMVRIEALMAR